MAPRTASERTPAGFPGTLAAAGALLVSLCAGPARASLPDLIGLGTRAPSQGGTGVASATGYEATYQNPAGLATGQRKLSVGVVYGGYRVELDGARRPVDDTAGLLIGAGVPLPLGGALRDRIGIGLGLYLPFGVVNRVRDPFPDEPRAALLDTRTQVVSVLVGGGVRLPGNVRIGGGVLALAALIGDITITPDGTGRITSISEEQLTVDFAPILGARWEGLGGRIAVGAVYRGTSRSTYRLRVRTELGDTLPLTLPTIYFAGVAQYDPMQVGAEIAFRPVESVQISVQASWKRWSAYAYPIDRATENSPPPPDPNFHDTVVPRVGVEWQALQSRLPAWLGISLRAGYFFEQTPTPSEPPMSDARNLLDASRHVVTAGIGLELKKRVPLSLELYGQGHFLAHSERLGGGFGVLGVALGVGL